MRVIERDGMTGLSQSKAEFETGILRQYGAGDDGGLSGTLSFHDHA